ncbi:tyrosine-type recombinase/integrase [Phenylobacterium sp.]|uniref:tyrosine-type recombinase/integrase n=1 Tax=Phenylobacterium sp. TaxID=1871053 RepID=UPI0035AEC049
MSDAEIQALAQDYYKTLAPQAERFKPRTSEPEWEQREQAALAEEEISDLKRQISGRSYKSDVSRAVDDALSQRNLQIDDLSASDANKLTNAIARALIENLRLFMHRLDEPVLPYEPVDPLLKGFTNASPPDSTPAPHVEGGSSFGSTISALVAAYLAAKRSSWVPKTYANRVQKLALFVEHLGASTRTSEITPDHMRAFRNGLSRMRRIHHTGCDRSFQGRQTDDEGARVDAKTVALHIADVKSMFIWAQKQGYLKEPPLAGLAVDQPKKPKGEKPRRPFGEAELRKLFLAPNFTGCRGPRRRFEAGSNIIRDGKFWIPIIAYYTGARLSELVQLHLEDANVHDGIPFIDVNENNPTGQLHRKHVKSEAGIRKIPLHSDLIALGFREFVASRRLDKRAQSAGRLFWEIPYGADGQPSSTFSKWFARLMDKAGLQDPALVFHSFRHTAEDALRNAKEPQYVINRIIGHDDGHISGEYGDGVSLEVSKAAVDAMKLPVSLVDLWS